MIFNQNVVFLALFILVLFIMAGFYIAAISSSFKRGTWKSTKEALLSMFRDPLFLTAFFAGIGSALYGQFEAMFVAYAGFIGYKLVATEIIVVSSGDNKFSWFEDSGINKIASFVISTKTLVALAGIGIIWIAGYKELYNAALVPERILALVGAWGTANGIPLLTLLKGKDMSFLKPIAKAKPTQQVEEPTYQQPVVLPATSQVIDSVPPKTTEYDPRPIYKPFVAQDWGYDPDEIIEKARSTVCWWTQNAVDFMNHWQDVAEQRFTDMFGFTIEEIPEHFNDKTLVKCEHGVKELATFLYGLEPEYRQRYRDTIRAQQVTDAFIKTVNRLGENWVIYRLKKGKTIFIDLFSFYTIPTEAEP